MPCRNGGKPPLTHGEDKHEIRPDRRRPGRRARGRDPSQGRPHRRDHAGRRRAGRALCAHGHSVCPEQVDHRVGCAAAQGRSALRPPGHPLPEPQGAEGPCARRWRHGRPRRRQHARLRPSAGGDRLVAVAAADSRHRPARRGHLLDAGGRPRHRREAPARQPRRDGGRGLRRRRVHEVAGGHRRQAVGHRRPRRPDPAHDDGADRQQHDAALAGGARRRRHHPGPHRAHRARPAAW